MEDHMIRQNNRRIKFLSLLLSALLTLPTLSSCSDTTVDNHSETVTSSTEESVQEEEIELTPSAMIRDKFADKNYDGREFRILGPQENAHYYSTISNTFVEIWVEDYTGEITNDAIYDRNAMAEELLNITIVPQWSNGTADINTRIKQAVSSASDDFDAALQSLSNLGTPLQNNELANLKNFETIDVESPWYDKNCTDTFTLFGNKLYWLTGDYMLCDDYAVHLIYFNKRIVTDAGQELPYDSVREGTWTIDKFYNMVKAGEQDLNGDGKLTLGKDVVAHIENHDKIKHWIYGSCEKSIEIDNEGNLKVNTLDERQISVVERLYQYTVEKEMTYSVNDDTSLQKYFNSGLASSYCIGLAQINVFREMADDFGVLPMPKYDENQENYGHYISNFVVTALCCPLTVKDREFSGTCIETLSAFSTETVSSALYDTLLKSKLIRDQDSVEMLQICLATKEYDWAVDFSWGGTFQSAYNNVYDKKTFNYVSEATKALKMQEKLLNKIIDTIAEFED